MAQDFADHFCKTRASQGFQRGWGRGVPPRQAQPKKSALLPMRKFTHKRHAKKDMRTFRMPSRLAENLFRQLEVDGDLGLNFVRFAVEQVWFVLPLFDRFRGRAGELRVSTQHFNVTDVARF